MTHQEENQKLRALIKEFLDSQIDLEEELRDYEEGEFLNDTGLRMRERRDRALHALVQAVDYTYRPTRKP